MSNALLLAAIAQNAVALFVIIDPLGGLPIFLSLLREMEPPARRRTVNLGVLVAVLILLLFATIGRRVLGLFGVGLPELMVAGGIMLVIIGLDEIFGFMAHLKTYSENVGIVPLACPLLAGPGAIVTTMLAIERNPFPGNYAIAFVGILLAMGASWIILLYTEPLMRVLGSRGSLILAKLMGILVTAIGTHFVLQGLLEFWQSAG